MEVYNITETFSVHGKTLRAHTLLKDTGFYTARLSYVETLERLTDQEVLNHSKMKFSTVILNGKNLSKARKKIRRALAQDLEYNNRDNPKNL